jgi:hypothetical protein
MANSPSNQADGRDEQVPSVVVKVYLPPSMQKGDTSTSPTTELRTICLCDCGSSSGGGSGT